ncbi:MAG: hypothetical protein IJM31_08215 [Campylobacter sp.]|nr:hypothetical protein [Campylobacter sp.]
MKKILSGLCLASALLFAENPQPQSAQPPQPAQPQQVQITSENLPFALAQLAMATNSTLPQRLDFVTIFDRAVVKDNVMKYYYILNDDEDFMLSKFKKDRKDKFLNDIKTNVKNSLCASEMSRDLLNAGATFNYNFELRNGNKYFQFSMDKSVCK